MEMSPDHHRAFSNRWHRAANEETRHMHRDALPIQVGQAPGRHDGLHIAVVTETYPPEVNGVAITAAHFIEGLRRLGHRIQLVRPRQDAMEPPAEETNFHEVLTRGLPIPGYSSLTVGLPARRGLIRRWSRHRPDVVHIVTEGPLGWSALQAADALSLPVVSDFRTNFHAYSQHYGIGWLKRPVLAYLRMFHNQTLATLVPTEAMRTTLEGDGFRNVQVISRGVDTSLFAPSRRDLALRAHWGAGSADPVVLHMGRLAPEKNPALVSLTFEAIRKQVPAARFVVVGDGPSRQSLMQRHPYAVFAGMRRDEELAAHLASADIFIFPSHTETYGNVTVEAMASGLAVVAFDYGAAGQHIRHDANGLLATRHNEGAFVRIATDAARDMGRATRLGTSAATDAQRLDWRDVVRDLESVLLGAATRRSTASGAATSRCDPLVGQ